MNVLFCVGKSYFPVHQLIVNKLEATGARVTCLMYDEAQNKQNIIEKIHDAVIYITAVAPADRAVIDAAPNLKYILKTGTGLDNVDMEYATEKGIRVSNAPGENATAVAELAVGLIIGISRKIPQLDRATKHGIWTHSNGFELQGKTLGIIGFGAIGIHIARMTAAFSMKRIAYGTHRDYETAGQLGVTFIELDQLLQEADYVVVSTALKKSNYHLLDGAAIAKMKPTAFLINVSRGAVIDSEALFAALKGKKIGGAALDVLETEPPAEPLPDLDNLIVTPHIGGTTQESVQRVAIVTIDNVRRFIDQEPLRYVANEKELNGGK
ncbi:MAG: NAD(P)-dependent oxidoreductase [Sporolactobacillus sp.]